MAAGDTGAEFERQLAQTRQLLDTLRSSGQGDSESVEIRGVGAAADGLLEVTVSAHGGGRVEGIHIDPSAMRRSSQDLAEELVLAANAALDDLRAKAAEQAAEAVGAVDLGKLAQQVAQAQDEGARRMERFTQALNEVTTRLGGRQ